MTETEYLALYAERETDGRCSLCETPINEETPEVAEMFDPTWTDETACFLVHGECGIGRGWEVG